MPFLNTYTQSKDAFFTAKGIYTLMFFHQADYAMHTLSVSRLIANWQAVLQKQHRAGRSFLISISSLSALFSKRSDSILSP